MRALRSFSLELKLPLFASGIIALVVVALALLAMREVRVSAEDRAEARLLDVSEQFATASNGAMQRRAAEFARVARRADIVNAVREPSAAAVQAARQALAALPADSTVLGTRLRDSRDSVVAVLGDSTILEHLTPPARSDSASSIGPLEKVGDTVAYAISVPVRDGGRVIGRIVQWRRIALTEQGRAAFRRFIGSDAELYFGNTANDLWIDMSGRVIDVPADSTQGRIIRRSHDGQQWLAVVRPLAGTPWLMSVEIPESYVMAQPRAFLRRFAIVSALLLLLGALLAVLLSRAITTPLKQLTAAAERVAAGDYAAAVVDDSAQDEIGRLARAFRVMSLRVQDTQQQLEADVAERQQEIRSTYEKLEAALEGGEKKTARDG